MADQLASEALDNLVTQFSSALDCLRELVQNSMDAGSPVIDIWTEFYPGDDAVGTIAFHVDDNGVGMDSAIIDGELTRLFSSSKEDDLTKIGKFGIGFVSSTDYGAGTASLIVEPEDVYRAVEVDDPSPPAAAALIDAAGKLLERIGGHYRRLVGCVLVAASDQPPMFLVAREVGPLMAIPPDFLAEKERPRRPEAAVNRDHPQFRALLRLQERSPGLAAYCLAKDLLLQEDRLIERDLDLLAAVFPEARAGTPEVRP